LRTRHRHGEDAGELACIRFRAQTNGQTTLTSEDASLNDPQASHWQWASQTGAEVNVGTSATYLPLVLKQ